MEAREYDWAHFLKVDMNTIENLEDDIARVQRGRFARVCVEIDLQKKLVPRVICQAALFNIEYEGLGLICFGCGRYGHRKEVCPWRVLPATSSTPADEDVTMATAEPVPTMSPATRFPTDEEQFGPWMMVQGGPKARFPKPAPGKRNFDEKGQPAKSRRKGSSSFSPSTFEMLEEWDREEQTPGLTAERTEGKWSGSQKEGDDTSGEQNRTKGVRGSALQSQKGKGKLNEGQKEKESRGELSKGHPTANGPEFKAKA